MDSATIADGVAQVAAPANSTFTASSGILSTLGYLCLVIAILLFLYWALKRFGPLGVGSVGNNPHNPKLLGRLFLGNRQSIAVVKIQSKTLVLGVTEHQITLLDNAQDESLLTPEETSNFAGLLKGTIEDAQES